MPPDGGGDVENPHSLLPRQERTRLFIGVREKPLHGAARCKRFPATRIVVLRPFKSVTDCACCHFAAAVRCEAGAFCVGFTQRPLRPPDCGSKKTAEAIGDRPVKPRLPLLIRSLARKCGHSPSSRFVTPAQGSRPKPWPGRAPVSFPPCNGAFSFRERKWGVALPSRPVGRNFWENPHILFPKGPVFCGHGKEWSA
jgi:hypothetical protein